MSNIDRQRVRGKLEELDSWRGDPVERRRCCMPSDYGKIQALCWVLGMSVDEWDQQAHRGETDE